MANTERIRWIDAARGIGIITIVVGHSYLPGYTAGPVFEFAYAFHVPLFMFLSGMLFKPEKHEFGSLITSRVRTIVMPYLIWATVSALLFALLGSFAGSALGRDSSASLATHFLNILWSNPVGGTMRWNTPLWFLTALVVVQLGAWLLARISRFTPWPWQTVLALSLILAVLALTKWTDVFLPWSAERAAMLLPFFVLGMILRPKASALDKLGTGQSTAGGIACWATMMLITRSNGLVDYVAKGFGNPTLWAIAALLGISGAVLLARAAEGCRWLRYLGAASMTILVLHKFPVVAMQVLLSRAGVQLAGNGAILVMIGVGTVALLMSSLCHPALKRFFPESIGMRRVRIETTAPRRALSSGDH